MEGVDETYALHNDAAIETGCVRFNDGVMSSLRLSMDIRCFMVFLRTDLHRIKVLDAIREATRLIDYMDYVVAKN